MAFGFFRFLFGFFKGGGSGGSATLTVTWQGQTGVTWQGQAVSWQGTI